MGCAKLAIENEETTYLLLLTLIKNGYSMLEDGSLVNAVVCSTMVAINSLTAGDDSVDVEGCSSVVCFSPLPTISMEVDCSSVAVVGCTLETKRSSVVVYCCSVDVVS